MKLSPEAEALFRSIYASYDAAGRPLNRGFSVSPEDDRAAAELRDAKLLTSGPFFGVLGHGKWALTERGRQGPPQDASTGAVSVKIERSTIAAIAFDSSTARGEVTRGRRRK